MLNQRLQFALLIVLVSLTFSCQQKSKKESEVNEEIPSLIIDELNSPTQESLRGISITNNRTIWLSGANGTILKSLDKGQNWKVLPSPDKDSLDLRSVWAFNERRAFIASAGFPSRVYATNDGGENWQLVHENLDSNAFMNSIVFRNESEGIIFGDQLDSSHFILLTNDSGQSWKRVPKANLPLPMPNENGYAASGSCIAIDKLGNYYIGLGGEKSRVFFSNNGQLWTAMNTSLKDTLDYFGIYSLAYGNNQLIGVGGSFLEKDHFYHPTILKLGDSTWHSSQESIFGYRSVIDYCASKDVWLSAGSNGIDLSLDGGQHWIVKSSQALNTLRFFKDQSMAIGANSDGKIFKLTID
ncbi:MAG: hypothetical protein CMO34_05150 [Verrucomicrobia bacterium]|nr:hypothetical protein [Verrucomicrobiota bacterium]